MNEVILLLLGIVGIFSLICSVALLSLGKMIDRYPVGDEASRERSISSPIESTKFAVIIFWLLFVPGAWAIFNESKIIMIAGITTLAAVCLFMFTALVFSFAVLSTMRKRRKVEDAPVIQAIPATFNDISLPQDRVSLPAPMTRKKYHPRVSSFMFDTLLKKD